MRANASVSAWQNNLLLVQRECAFLIVTRAHHKRQCCNPRPMDHTPSSRLAGASRERYDKAGAPLQCRKVKSKGAPGLAFETWGPQTNSHWKHPSSSLSLGEASVVQNHIEERLMNPNAAVVFNKAELAKAIHEEANAGPGGADHLGQSFLRDLRN
jgi:hypothetical protein